MGIRARPRVDRPGLDGSVPTVEGGLWPENDETLSAHLPNLIQRQDCHPGDGAYHESSGRLCPCVCQRKMTLKGDDCLDAALEISETEEALESLVVVTEIPLSRFTSTC